MGNHNHNRPVGPIRRWLAEFVALALFIGSCYGLLLLA